MHVITATGSRAKFAPHGDAQRAEFDAHWLVPGERIAAGLRELGMQSAAAAGGIGRIRIW
jgi:hypothetical protein